MNIKKQIIISDNCSRIELVKPYCDGLNQELNFDFKKWKECINKGYIPFYIQNYRYSYYGHRLNIYDHRLGTQKCASEIIEKESTIKTIELYDRLVECFTKPAFVQVVEILESEKDEENKSNKKYYLNLYNLFNNNNNNRSDGLLTIATFVGKHNASYEEMVKEPLWLFESYSSSRSGRHWSSTYITITNRYRKFHLKLEGYANIGHSPFNRMIISNCIFWLS